MPRSVSLASSGTSIWPPLTSLTCAMAVILVFSIRSVLNRLAFRSRSGYWREPPSLLPPRY
jgi:hypothetical protein